MASSKKRTRSLSPDEEEEEAHPKEQIDINKEEEEEEEEGEMDEEYDRDRYLDKESEERDEIVTAAFAISQMMFKCDITQARNQREMESETETDEYDDSEQTLGLLSRWDIPAIPPRKIVRRGLIEQCSRPIRKQLTVKDVCGVQIRLALSKSQVTKKFLPFLEESKIPRGKEGISVSVYGPDGKVHEMKMLADEKNISVLTTGWRKFVRDYELKEICDFITIWMFRHKESHQICLAIDSKRFSLRKQVTKRISKAAFKDSD